VCENESTLVCNGQFHKPHIKPLKYAKIIGVLFLFVFLKSQSKTGINKMSKIQRGCCVFLLYGQILVQ